MRAFLDTNVVLRFTIADAARHAEVRSALERLVQAGWELCVSLQVILVALMLSRGVNHIVTLNPTDFARYPEITCLVPPDV